MKKILIFLISLFVLMSCAVQQYSNQYGYNNVTVYGENGTPKAYYHMVTVTEHIEQDSLVVVTFQDQGGRIVTVSGKNIVVETVILQRVTNNTRYIYYESRPHHLYPYTYYRGGWHYNKPLPRYHRPPYHRPQPHPGHHSNPRPGGRR